VRRRAQPQPEPRVVLDADAVRRLREGARAVYVADELAAWAVQLVRHTRAPAALVADCHARPDAARMRAHHAEALALLGSDPVRLGASPRASIDLVAASRAHALLEARDHVTHHDVRRVAPDVLRHRITLGFEAEADGVSPDDIVAALLELVPAP